MPPTGQVSPAFASRMDRPSGVSYLGIDPGASGGLSSISPLSSLRKVTVTAIPMPETERDVWEWFKTGRSAVEFAVIEKVGGFIQGNPAPGSAMFNFGRGTGLLIGFLIACHIPFEEITPQKWQKGLGIAPRRKDEEKTQFKNRLKAFAQKLFPDIKVTLKTCDSLLIAEFARRYREGKL